MAVDLKGWAEFVQQYDLQLGDILVFRHEGNVEFEVSIFDSTHCDREYAEYMQEEGGAHTGEEISKKFKFKDAAERARLRIKLSKKASSHVKAATHHHKSFRHSHFECTISKYCYSRCYLCLPRQFAYANGLTNKKCGLIIRGERQRSWNSKLSYSESRTYIGHGWHKFFADNCLNKGDHIMFEVLTNGETPIWKFQVTNRETSLQKFQGNLFSTDSWKDALKGVTSVISCVGGFGSNSHMYKINGTANINAIRAASEEGVKRFVYISAADFGIANYVLQGYYEGKRAAETELLTRYPYGGIILRPGFIYGTRRVGSMKLPLGVIGSPLELILQRAKPLSQIPLVVQLFLLKNKKMGSP